MRGKLWFLGGLATGFVLGTRAGREKYDEIVHTAQKIKESPTIQEATGVVQVQATRLYSESKDKLANSRLADTKIGERLLSSTNRTPRPDPTIGDAALDDTFAPAGSMPATTSTTATGSVANATYAGPGAL